MTAALLDELRWRGMFHDATPGLEARLEANPAISGYVGFDPSAPSFHIGTLVPIFGLIHLQRHGGRPVAVLGGGTGMIGDPSGRTSERQLLDDATLEANAVALREQLGRFLDFTPGTGGAVMVNNIDWLGRLSLIEFLRDVGKHFTIPYMLAKDSVQARLERGLSYTEFSYMLLQAADFEHLHRTMGVELQMGGADQWGNITAGLELIRRRGGDDELARAGGPAREAFALAYPLLLTPSGAKFGKSEAGESIWLDANRTSPFAFYQHWLHAEDRDVDVYLRWFTLFTREEIGDLGRQGAARPEARVPQRALALDITARVHGPEAASLAVKASEAAFSAAPIEDPAILESLHRSLDGFEFSDADLTDGAVRFAIASGTFASSSEARRTMQQGGFSINGQRMTDPAAPIPAPIDGKWLVVRVGKRRVRIGRRRRPQGELST